MAKRCFVFYFFIDSQPSRTRMWDEITINIFCFRLAIYVGVLQTLYQHRYFLQKIVYSTSYVSIFNF